jgi:hypothetical protein
MKRTKLGLAALMLVAATCPLGAGCSSKTPTVANEPVACSFFPDPEPAACERRGDGRLVVLPEALARPSSGRKV